MGRSSREGKLRSLRAGRLLFISPDAVGGLSHDIPEVQPALILGWDCVVLLHVVPLTLIYGLE